MTWSFDDARQVDYTHGYYRNLSPAMLRFACLRAGVRPPDRQAEGNWRYLELGFGQGLSVNIHAAASQGDYWGTDYNPTHAARAGSMAAAAGTGARLLDASFAELAARDDLPEFDVIALHGIWSWISDEAAADIIRIIQRRLKIGGLVSISYNCLPGAGPAIPLRHLLKLHASLAGTASDPAAAMEAALGFVQSIADSSASHFRHNPIAEARLKHMFGQSRSYLVHEYLAADFRVPSFADVARQLAEAKLQFVASSHLLDAVDGINLTPDAAALLAGIGQPVLRETARDYLINQTFRRDVFVRGRQAMSALQQHEALMAQAFVLTQPAEKVPYVMTGPVGEVSLQEPLFRPLVAALARDGHAPKTMAALGHDPALVSFGAAGVAEALVVLTGAGYVELACTPRAEAIAACQRLNTHLLDRARGSDEIGFLASPVSGGGIAVSRTQQLFLLAARHGAETPGDQGAFVWGILASQGQRLMKDGVPLSGDADSIALLAAEAADFAAARAPILAVLGIS